MADREVILKMKDGSLVTTDWEIGQEIVRCKDCKYILSGTYIRQCCRSMSHWQKVDDDWFCAGGERKE